MSSIMRRRSGLIGGSWCEIRWPAPDGAEAIVTQSRRQAREGCVGDCQPTEPLKLGICRSYHRTTAKRFSPKGFITGSFCGRIRPCRSVRHPSADPAPADHHSAVLAADHSITLDTARLRLRAHRKADLARLVTLAGTWEVASWLANLPHPYTEDHGRDWIAHVRQAHVAGNPRAFAVALRETDQLIGGVGLDGRSGDSSAETIARLLAGQPYWGRGYAREAIGAIIGYGFRKLRIETMFRAITDPDNIASQKVLLACGFTEDCRYRPR